MLFKRSNIQFIIAGLGNPGNRYAQTRHNAGFWMLDALASRYCVKVARNRFHALCADGNVGDCRVLFMKPMTFMNLSGTSLSEAARFYKVPADQILVLCDDITLPPGVIRIRQQGSSGGHKGLASLIQTLGTDHFPRIKIGVGGAAHPDMDLVDWVIGKPDEKDLSLIMNRSDDIIAAVKLIVDGRCDLAQSRYNK